MTTPTVMQICTSERSTDVGISYLSCCSSVAEAMFTWPQTAQLWWRYWATVGNGGLNDPIQVMFCLLILYLIISWGRAEGSILSVMPWVSWVPQSEKRSPGSLNNEYTVLPKSARILLPIVKGNVLLRRQTIKYLLKHITECDSWAVAGLVCSSTLLVLIHLNERVVVFLFLMFHCVTVSPTLQ